MTDIEQMKPASRSGFNQRWLVTFTDLIALLLAFFVMMYSMSAVVPEPWEKMTNSLVARLNPDFGWDSLASLSDLNAETATSENAADLDYLQVVISGKIHNIPALSQALLTRLSDRLIISLEADSLFNVASASLGEDARTALRALGETLRHIGNRIDVNGHTDPSPMRGGQYASNWELSLHRAVAVADALASAGYTQEIIAMGFAESRFDADQGAADVDRKTRFRLARRVDVVVRETQSTESNHGV